MDGPPNSEKENQGAEIHADGCSRGKFDWFDVTTDRLEKGLIESVQLLSNAVGRIRKNPIQDDGNEKTQCKKPHGAVDEVSDGSHR